ncbi:hypothetical protein ACET3Z_031852 [Daucus carota]
MASPPQKKLRVLEAGDESDRISRLPDDLIHKILSFLDAKEAVQTTCLSKRWKPVWTTLPFLNFGRYHNSSPKNISNFICNVLRNRNHQSHVFSLNFRVNCKDVSPNLLEKFIEYAISHDLQSLRLELLDDHKPFKLSTFSSKSLKKLELNVRLQECALKSDCWDLPALTTLRLSCVHGHESHSRLNLWLKDSVFTCLPALTRLSLYNWDLSQLFSFSLPALTRLRLSHCTLPKTVWDFPDLLSLQLDGVCLPDDMSDILFALVKLKNLTLCLPSTQRDYFISCPPQLLNLSIKVSFCRLGNIWSNIVVSAPKLCNFTAFGIFATTIGVPELENVNISLQGWFPNMELKCRKRRYYRRLTNMLSGLGNAKNLTFDLESIEALNTISNLLQSLPSPFSELKYVKLPTGCQESSISSALRSYLLGGSPNATFVTKLPQIHGVEDSMLDAPVEGTDKDQASSLRGKSDSGLWRGHEVNSEFVDLLDRIMHKYPETFEHFTTINKKLCTMNLNMLCTSLNDLFKISMTNVDSEMSAFKEVISYLQNQGFNLTWLVDRLTYIEHLRFSKPQINELYSIECHIDDAKTKLQDLQSRAADAKTKLQDLLAHVDYAKTRLQEKQSLARRSCQKLRKLLELGMLNLLLVSLEMIYYLIPEICGMVLHLKVVWIRWYVVSCP